MVYYCYKSPKVEKSTNFIAKGQTGNELVGQYQALDGADNERTVEDG